MRFEELKTEVLRRAKTAYACTSEYTRAEDAATLTGLMSVIKDNFHFATGKGVICPSLIKEYENEFNANEIYRNTDVERGFLLCDNATVVARGNATVVARGNAAVVAWGNASVVARGNSYVSSYTLLDCKLSDNAIYRVRRTNTLIFASEDIRFEKQ